MRIYRPRQGFQSYNYNIPGGDTTTPETKDGKKTPIILALVEDSKDTYVGDTTHPNGSTIIRCDAVYRRSAEEGCESLADAKDVVTPYVGLTTRLSENDKPETALAGLIISTCTEKPEHEPAKELGACATTGKGGTKENIECVRKEPGVTYRAPFVGNVAAVVIEAEETADV